MKQACNFAKVCDREVNQKYIGVIIFSLQLCVHEYRLKILCENGTKCVSRYWGLLLENSGAIGRRFDVVFAAKCEFQVYF